jgi:hypothetical protein
MLPRRLLAHAARSALRLGNARAGHPWLLTGARHFSIPPPEDDYMDPVHNKQLESVFLRNEAWRQEQLSEDAAYFQKLGSGHKPKCVGTAGRRCC